MHVAHALLGLGVATARTSCAYQFVAGRIVAGAELRTASWTLAEARAACDREPACECFDAPWPHAGAVELNATLRSRCTAAPGASSVAYFRLAPHERGYDFAPAPPGDEPATTAEQMPPGAVESVAESVQQAMRQCDALADCVGFVPVDGKLRLWSAHEGMQRHGYAKREPLLVGPSGRSLTEPPTFSAQPGALRAEHVFATLAVESGFAARALCAREPRCAAYALALHDPALHVHGRTRDAPFAPFFASFGGREAAVDVVAGVRAGAAATADPSAPLRIAFVLEHGVLPSSI
ncbi:hypothetical protein KFE25_006177 [Diacronema lutheri]|uniref:Apple domain-containing protein n=1 Tax=Diacronema lutheri TaxID=2081491 RepID=A0A8J5XW45_DIALT|nr:hypothetical protein KFE25_006177 [Diacronema lutheri]